LIEKLHVLSKLNTKIDKKLAELEYQFANIANTQANHTILIARITRRIKENEDNMRDELSDIRRRIPDYVWIGYTHNKVYPLLVPINIKFDAHTIKTYFNISPTIIIDHLKYLKNVLEIKVEDFCLTNQSEIVFKSLKDIDFSLPFFYDHFNRNHAN